MSHPRPYTMRRSRMSRWTVPLAERRTAARIEDAKAALFDILAIWDDVDMGVVSDMDEKIQELDTWLEEHQTALKERIECGEEIGL